MTAFRFTLDELKVAYEQVILFGRSIGSGPSVYLASRFPIGGLILVAAFTSVRDAAKGSSNDIGPPLQGRLRGHPWAPTHAHLRAGSGGILRKRTGAV